jgi:hypothetical protein
MSRMLLLEMSKQIILSLLSSAHGGHIYPGTVCMLDHIELPVATTRTRHRQVDIWRIDTMEVELRLSYMLDSQPL